MPSFVVVLDTCVLFPAALRDTLLRAADAGLFQARWSDDILEELRRNLIRLGLDGPDVQHLLTEMGSYFPDAACDRAYKQLISQMPNHPKDRHVLAAAVACHAEVIVTYNLKDFPRSALSDFHVEAQSPDEFLTDLFDLDPNVMLRILQEQARDLKSPPMAFADFITLLDKKLRLHDFTRAVLASLSI